MKPLDLALLKKFLKLAGEELTGDWVLIGGTVLPLLGMDFRSTTDIDLIGLTAFQQIQTLKLMDLAEKLGLPIESINQAGAYFLSKISDYQKHLVLLHQGPSANIFRPDATLFLKLKIGRLSDSDLQDCLKFIAYARQSDEKISTGELGRLIQKEMKAASGDREKRLLQLLKKLSPKNVPLT